MKVKVDLQDISTSYDGRHVLEKINFHVDEGDFLGVIGPNGSGKTTLLRTIGGVLKPDGGVINLDGFDIHRLSRREVAKSMAAVAQETNINFAFTAFEIVLMGRAPHVTRFKTEGEDDLVIAEEAMKKTETWHLADRPIIELSGGEKQRVVIAQALAQKPRLFLLDEPTAHLDIHHQLQILNLIKAQNKGGLAVIAVFHDLNLASRFSDSLVLLDEGQVHTIGSPDEVLTAQNVKEVFKVDAHVDQHPVTNETYIYPI